MEIEPVLLSVEHVAKTFSSARHVIPAVQDVSFTVRRSEFVTLVGPSGCGKTTILRIVAGLDTPTSGKVTFDGSLVTGPDHRRGIVSQTYSVFPWLTVKRNIAFGLGHLTRAERDSRVMDWLHKIKLDDFADSFPKALSGGMRQRVALARALMVDPDLILLDESMGALDEHMRVEIQAFLLDTLREFRCGALLVTHSIREALALSDRIVVLSDRPASVLDDIEIPWSRPRPSGYEVSNEYTELYQLIIGYLSSTQRAEYVEPCV